jgi:UDP-N-acetylmuramate dehydrogenase
MLQIEKNFTLHGLNTFHIEASCNFFTRVTNIDDLKEAIRFSDFKKLPVFVLGGGSNILFTRNFNGFVIQPCLQEISQTGDDGNYIYLKVGAGIEWDKLVELTVDNEWGCLENLSLIPGHVGACSIQNIGAYGAEVKDSIVQVECVNLDNAETFSLTNNQCQFAYRTSIFKKELAGKVIITNVTFRLSRKIKLNISYGSVADELKKFPEINIKTVRQAVINIRRKKLPDPELIGNAGSFFKNPVIQSSHVLKIKHDYPDLPEYQISEHESKIPAAYLIEKCGWKGYRIGDAGVYPGQPLVLVNYGKAKGEELLKLSENIVHSVHEKFGITLEREINIV